MNRRYAEQVEVQVGPAGEHGVRLAGGATTQAEVPTVFLWRGRVHLVQAVLAQWSQRVPWWRPDQSESGLERQVWRVEAGAGRSLGTGVYDLVQDERWWLERVSD